MQSAEALPVGEAEISERLGVRQQTVAQWKLRGLLPAPRWTVSRHPAWNWPEIRDWAMQRNSLRRPTSYTFGYYVTLDAIERDQADRLLAEAGATLPIRWGQHRTLVKFHREADNYSEATVFVFNQLVGTGVELTGGPIPEDARA